MFVSTDRYLDFEYLFCRSFLLCRSVIGYREVLTFPMFTKSSFSVGQCGNQIGCRFWDLALREHAHVNKVSRSMQIWWGLQLMNYGLYSWISAKKVVWQPAQLPKSLIFKSPMNYHKVSFYVMWPCMTIAYMLGLSYRWRNFLIWSGLEIFCIFIANVRKLSFTSSFNLITFIHIIL